jgi:glycine/D-amino acid oxidase-like deaminating enzyme
VWLDDYPSRETQIDLMSKESEYDIVVIGGGATGCGVAADAASRGAFESDDHLHVLLLCLH